jgi:hypothetical protein
MIIFCILAPQTLLAMEKPELIGLDSWKTPMNKVYMPSDSSKVESYKPANTQTNTQVNNNKSSKAAIVIIKHWELLKQIGN